MALIKASSLRDMSDDELTQKKNTLKKELFNLRYEVRIGRVERPHRISQARREIAQIETIQNERKRAK